MTLQTHYSKKDGSIVDQSEHFTAKPPLKKSVFAQYLLGGAEGS